MQGKQRTLVHGYLPLIPQFHHIYTFHMGAFRKAVSQRRSRIPDIIRPYFLGLMDMPQSDVVKGGKMTGVHVVDSAHMNRSLRIGKLRFLILKGHKKMADQDIAFPGIDPALFPFLFQYRSHRFIRRPGSCHGRADKGKEEKIYRPEGILQRHFF